MTEEKDRSKRPAGNDDRVKGRPVSSANRRPVDSTVSGHKKSVRRKKRKKMKIYNMKK